MSNHSKIVGGSTAKRVIGCPGSVALCATMPPKPSSKYADEGTLLHDAIAQVLDKNVTPESLLGMTYQDQVLTQELIDNKLHGALNLLMEVDPNLEMEYAVETKVNFGDFLPDVFGSCDLIGRIINPKIKRAICLDWKFGDGVIVEAEENEQLLFYVAAAMRTPSVSWAFEGIDEIECVIIQPPMIKRWVTSVGRVKQFEVQLAQAVQKSAKTDAPIMAGDHCRWCAAKPVCPKMTGAVDRALNTQLESLDASKIGAYLGNCDLLEQWITDLRALAHQMLEADKPVPGWKLVNKRATRSWTDEKEANHWLDGKGLEPDQIYEKKIISPAGAEKLLKKNKIALPQELVVAVSSGSTLAREDDPRPAVVNIGKQLTAALSKIQ
jgi:hypothetical protein